jgi:hypothetical protein
MKSLCALLKDRRRSQQGSVLGGVLIITAFLAILSGALMTELSTNFLLSTDLVNRVNTEATVSSAAEMYINQLQGTPLNTPCPGPVATSQLNGQTAAATNVICSAVIYWREPQALTRIGTSINPFQVDGTYAHPPAVPGLNDYVVGDSGGNVYDYTFANGAQRWRLQMGGAVTGPPLVVVDPTQQGGFLDMIPASGSACTDASSPNCLSVWSDDGSFQQPAQQCVMAVSAPVRSQPAVGRNVVRNVFVADAAGGMYLVDAGQIQGQGQGGDELCDLSATANAGGPVVAGPVVFPAGGNRDWIFVLTSNGGSTSLVRFSADSQQSFLSQVNFASLFQPSWGKATGVAAAPTAFGSKFAVSFAGGVLALVQIDAAGNPSLIGSQAIGANPGAPYWCSCNLVGVGAGKTLYVVDASSFALSTYLGTSPITTRPAADGLGDWYFGASDGNLYEAQKQGQAMAWVGTYGAAAASIGSSPVVGPCQVGVCAYLASADTHAYEVSLDARNAVLTACISAQNMTCTGTNPRLWTRAEIGVSGNKQTVHIQGWSYYAG